MNSSLQIKFFLKKYLNLAYNQLLLFFGSKKTEEVNYFLVFFRICISVIAIVDILSMYQDWQSIFSPTSTLIPQKFLFLFSEYFKPLNTFYNFLNKNELTNFFYQYAIYCYLLMLFLLAVGCFTRVMAIACIILQLLIFKSFNELNYGYDQFLTMSLFYCFVFPSGRAYSLDSRLFPCKRTLYNFDYSKVIALHLFIVYFFSGLSKAFDPQWWNGGALWRAVASVYNDYFKIPSAFFAIIGVITMILETCYPLFVYIKKTRKLIVSGIILMHIGIAIILRLYSFSMIMSVWNIAVFYHFGESQKKHNA